MTDTAEVTPEAKALEGKVTVDATDVIEAEVLAYQALRRVAGAICARVDAKIESARAIVIHSETDMTAWTAFRTFAEQLSYLRSAYSELGPSGEEQGAEEIVGTIVAATTGIKAFIDLIALFRTDREIYGVSITIEDLALVSEAGGAFARKGRRVYVTQLYPRSGDARPIEMELDATRKEAQSAKLRIANITDANERVAAEARLAQLDAIRTGYEDLFTKVVAEGTTALATLVRGAGIAALMSAAGGAHVLYLKMLKAAGTNETKRSLLSGSRLLHSGGVVVNYVLFQDDGSILLSGTIDGYEGEVEKVKGTV